MTVLSKQLIVFTDLDGTLLDHETYSFEAALPALNRLKKNGIPLVLTTSKTWAEVQELQQELDIQDPCIVENGSAIFNGPSKFFADILKGQDVIFGQTYSDIRTWIDALPEALRREMTGFGDMSIVDVVKATGLSPHKAEKAKDRLASEPFLWSGENEGLDQLKVKLDENEMALLQGGRFYHILSKVDKRLAIDWIMSRLRDVQPDITYHTCALGDGPNDTEMIAHADTGVVIANPHGNTINVNNVNGEIVKTIEPGPAGWNTALHALMDRLGID